MDFPVAVQGYLAAKKILSYKTKVHYRHQENAT